MMAMLSFVLFNYKRVKQIEASQKCGAFFEFYIENRWTCGKCCGMCLCCKKEVQRT